MPKQKFIVTADDYGVSPLIDDAIQRAVSQNLVTAVAVFANGKNSIANAKRLKSEFNEISIGIHFTITSGNRLNDNAYSLSKRNGKKRRAFRGVTTQHPDKAKENHLELELMSQIAEFEKAGLTIEFFSDHQGILSNTYKGLETMIKVIKAYNQKMGGITQDFKAAKLRNPLFVSQVVGKNNCLDRSKMYNLARAGTVAKNIMRKKTLTKISFNFDTVKAFLKIIYLEGLDTSDYFVEHFLGSANAQTLKCISKSIPKKSNELKPNTGQQDITSEIVVHLAIVPDNHKQNKSYMDEERKMKNHGGVCANYSLLKRNKELIALEKYLITYIPKTELCSYNF